MNRNLARARRTQATFRILKEIPKNDCLDVWRCHTRVSTLTEYADSNFGGCAVKPTWSARRFRIVSVVAYVIAVMLATFVVAVPSADAARTAIKLHKAPKEKELPSTVVGFNHAGGVQGSGNGLRGAHDWPAAASTLIDLPARSGVVVGAGQTDLSLENTGSSAPARSLKVAMLAEKASSAARVAGPMFTLTGDLSAAGTRVNLDYSSFANLGGADWGQRLQLVELPACSLTTPQLPACQVATPIPSTNDGRGHLTALVPQMGAPAPASSPVPAPTTSASSSPSGTTAAPAGHMLKAAAAAATTTAGSTQVLAATAGPSSSNGAFTATSLAPSASWNQSGATGAFTYSYPITSPPPGTGGDVAPQISLDYNSASVDGQINTSNNQSSMVGEGWDYDPGYVERTYRTCSDLTTIPSADQTSDLCWAGYILTLHLPGGPTEAVVRDDTTGAYHLQNDNGDRVQYVTGANNGALNGEYWVVTTKAGIKYTFGINVLPGGTTANATNSVWTVPVYGPMSGNPCYSATSFAASRCNQAWRWNLDMVQDTHNNAAAYYYAKETNSYGADKGTTAVAYTRNGYLTHINYGLTTSTINTSTPPETINFSVAERCVPSTGVTCAPSTFAADFTTAHASNWPDTPVDLNCSSNCNTHAPTFWSVYRYSTITTNYLSGTTEKPVDSYALTHGYPATGDAEMSFDKVVRTATGTDGSTIAVAPVTFGYTEMDSRVAGYGTDPAMAHNRLISINTETGEDIVVDYEGGPGQAGRAPALCTGTTVPSSPSSDTTECYPVYWIQPGNTNPTLDYFHKYVVTEVDQDDANGTGPNRITTYNYLGNAWWRYDDNEVLKPADRTYGQFRGYRQVETRTGNAQVNVTGQAADQQTLTRTTYFTGMDGNTAPGGGTQPASISDSLGASYTDANQYAGMPLESTTFNGSGGAQIATTITNYSTIASTASRARAGLPNLTATVVGQIASTTYTNKAAGGTNTTATTTTYNNEGLPTTVTTTATGAPSSCVSNTYATNSTTWVQDTPSEVATYSGACNTGTLLRDTRTYYDSNTTLGAVSAGDPTEVDQAKSGSGSSLTFTKTTTGYDTYGRPTSATAYDPGASAGNRTTTTAYTPTGTGALTQTVVTNPLSQKTTTVLDPSRGNQTKVTDVAGRVTSATYDALGRTTAVWKPGQVQGTNNATVKYAYQYGPTAPLAVTTQTLVDAGNNSTPGYVTSIKVYDAFGTLRQTQTDGVGGGRAVTDNYPDSHGWAVLTDGPWFTSGSPSTSLVTTPASGINDRKITSFDGTGRPTQVADYNGNTLTSTAKTIYGGDRTTSIPPAGGITQTAISDGAGNQVELDQYKTAPTINGNQVSGGTYDKETFSYDALGQQIGRTTGGTNSASANANWSTVYDLLGRPATQTDPDSGTTNTAYFDTGEVATTTDGAGRAVAYDYDALGRKIGKYQTSLTGTKLAAWKYDTASNGVGQIASSTSYTGGYSYTETAAGYDANGNPLGSTLTSTDPALSLVSSYPTTETWTSTHLLASETTADTAISPTEGTFGETLTYWYDNHGDPNGLTGTNSYVSGAVYTPYGELSQLTLGISTATAQLTYSRDPQTRRVTDINFSGQTAYPQLEDLSYRYDLSGNPTETTDVEGPSGAATETQCYAYNGLDQLTEAWSATDACAVDPGSTGSNSTVGGPQSYWTNWGYDDSGNRASQIEHAVAGGLTADTSTIYTMADPNHVHALSSANTTGGTTRSAAYTYNGDGAAATSLVGGAQSTFNYGPDGQLANVVTSAGSSKYVRDADGNILTRTDPAGNTTLYLPGEEVTIAPNNAAVTVNAYYTVGGQTVGMRVNNNNPLDLMADLHGSAQVAVDPATWAVTRRYLDPFGNPLGAPSGGSWPDSHGFLGKSINSATALVDVGAREYDSTTGRFISVDPVLSADPQAANRYAYADNNPLTNSDPSGLHLVGANGEEVPYCDSHVCGQSRPAQDAQPNYSGMNRTVRHNLNAMFAMSRLEDQVFNFGGEPSGFNLETPVPGGSKSGTGYDGRADITYDDGVHIFVWEVKSGGQIYNGMAEALWYVTKLQEAQDRAGTGRVVQLGWSLGAPSLNPMTGDDVEGTGPGEIMYSPGGGERWPYRVPKPVPVPVPPKIPIYVPLRSPLADSPYPVDTSPDTFPQVPGWVVGVAGALGAIGTALRPFAPLAEFLP